MRAQNMVKVVVLSLMIRIKNINNLFEMGYTFAVLGSDLFILWKWAEQMKQIMNSIRKI